VNHIAVIPARMGSEGYKHKNRIFYRYTEDFLRTLSWIKQVIVSTDDPVIVQYAEKSGFDVHIRPESLAGPAVSIHSVFAALIKDKNIDSEALLWLFYLPVLYRNQVDFEYCRSVMEQGQYGSLCTFVRAKSHPFNCWKYDEKTKKIEQYVKNDCFRRQDLPPAWTHYHYVYCFRARVLDSLNSEMINQDTYPYFVDDVVRDKLIEIDTPEDYERWKAAGCPSR
jgi:CMP-N-acetylneuraminic acid synthetase